MRRFNFGLLGLASAIFAFLTLPTMAAPDAALFGQLPAVYDADLSPDGKQIAILQNHQGRTVVNILDLADLEANQQQKSRVVGMQEGVKPLYVKWVSNYYVVVSVEQVEVKRNVPYTFGHLHIIDVKTMETWALLRGNGVTGARQFNNEVLDWLEDDPDHILMQFPDIGDSADTPSIWKVRIKNDTRALVRRYKKGVSDWITDNVGEPRLGLAWKDRGRRLEWEIKHPETGKWDSSETYPGLDPDNMGVLAITDGGKNLIVRAYRDADTLGLHRYDLVTRSFVETLYQNANYDVGSVILSKDGNEVVGVHYTGDTEQTVLFDEYGSTMEEALAAFSDYEVRFIDQSDDGEQVLIQVSGPSQPGGLFLFKRGGERVSIIANRAELMKFPMGKVVSLGYPARDGETIPAYLTGPAGFTGELKNLPFIILPHGGPYARDVKQFDWLAQMFAGQGYAVLQMNFRGSDGFGKRFADAGRDDWVVMQNDVEDAMRWLLDNDYADPNRSCIAGWSYGGYSALMGAANHPDLYRCAIAIAALSDIPEAMSDARKYIRGAARAERTFGALRKDGELMRANNPVDRAADITIPVFMAHGTLDASVEFDQYEKMKRRLERAGVAGTYMSFKDEDHYMSNQANRQAMVEGIEAFLRRVNGKSPFILE